MASSDVVINGESRPLAHFAPSLWGDLFTTYTRDDELWEKYSKENNSLKDEVRSMLVASTETAVEKLNLINAIERLGVSYHFEEEIEQQLEEMFKSHAKLESYGEYDLFTTSLFFRIFRQHGYIISSQVFKKFKDSCHEFDQGITKDTKGMLSLYEAAFLRTRKDHILDEAVTFTTYHLKASNLDDDSSLGKQVKHALEQPLHKGMTRLETWTYISFYEEDPCKNDLLLKFAKLDFNILQMLHKQELCEVMRWWEDLDIAGKLPFLRNRVVEGYFWTLSIYYEPCFSLGRNKFAKMVCMLSLTDDMCDAYGTMDEIDLYSDAVERLDMSCIDGLPDYMKFCYAALLGVFQEFDEEMTKLGTTYCLPYLKETFKRTMRAYHREARWRENKYVPSFQEYCDTAFPSAGEEALIMSSFIGMEGITLKTLDWALNNPKCLVAVNAIGRLTNDIVGYEENNKREHVATAIDCYSKEYGVSVEEAIAKLWIQIEDAWKDINEECLGRPTPIPSQFMMRYLNMGRICHAIYTNGDGYTHPENVTQFQIKALIIDPIPI